MLWTHLDSKTIGLWGMGREGLATQMALQKHAPHARIIEISEDTTHQISDCEILIKSPGVSLYRPEIQDALAHGITVTSGTNLFFEYKNPASKVIAVTGTKGKSTTSSLLAHTLKHLGFSVCLGGNIGKPLIDFTDEKPDFVVTASHDPEYVQDRGRTASGRNPLLGTRTRFPRTFHFRRPQ